MKKLLSRELSLKYSARGKKQKKDFSKLNLYKAVLGIQLNGRYVSIKLIELISLEAVRNSFPGATELEMTQYIGITLATAGDRDGGRKHRAGIVDYQTA